MSAAVEIVHVLPHRLRLRIPELKRNPHAAAELEEALRRSPEVIHASANPVTGSVVVEFDPAERESVVQTLPRLVPGVDAAELEQREAQALEQLRAALEAREPAHANGEPDWSGTVLDKVRALNDEVRHATGGPDLRILLPAALLALGGYRVATAHQLKIPSWYELFWFCFNSFATLNGGGRRDGRPREESAR